MTASTLLSESATPLALLPHLPLMAAAFPQTLTSIQDRHLNCTSHSFSLLCFLEFQHIFFYRTLWVK